VIELVDPRGSGSGPAKVLAPRPKVADIRRIGFLSNEEEFMNGSLHFPRYTRILARVFEARLGVTDFHWEAKPLLSRPAEIPQLERLLKYDAVINGLAK
jgi:hypothetical protein